MNPKLANKEKIKSVLQREDSSEKVLPLHNKA